MDTPHETTARTPPPAGNVPYQAYELDEETERLAYHYEVDPEFFMIVTGGEWNTYSCSIWEEGFDMTQAQEKKLDQYAALMRLEPGQRILDVGCGWGGPLVYLCHKYGAVGHGITVSPIAIPVAEARAARYGVEATFEVVHWENLPEIETYDAVFTDEVVVHFQNLDGFFAKCHAILKPGGMMVNKELHFTHSSYAQWTDRLSQHINKVYGYTGNYRTLIDELLLVDKNGFRLTDIYQIPIAHYRKTIEEGWLASMHTHREHLEQLTSPEHYRDFRMYLKAIMWCFRRDFMRLHMVASQKID